MPETPTQRTLKWARGQGWLAGVVEYWQPSFAERAVTDAATRAVSTTNMDMDELRRAVATRRKWGPGVRRDLFGFIDIVAVTPEGIIGIQCTTTANLSHRQNKIHDECAAPAAQWIRAGGRIMVVGWKRYANPVDRRWWRETVREITLEDLAG